MSGEQINFRVEVESYLAATFLAIQHGMTTGTGPLVVRCIDGRALPVGLQEGTDYWAIGVRELGLPDQDPDRFQLATSAQNARDGIAIQLTAPGAGYFLIGPR